MGRIIFLVLNVVLSLLSFYAAYKSFSDLHKYGESMGFSFYIIIGFFILFGLIFILIGFLIKNRKIRSIPWNRNSLYITNVFCILLFCFTAIYTKKSYDEMHQFYTNSIEVEGQVFKIEAEGFRKKRVLHFMYGVDDSLYKGVYIDDKLNRELKLGDSISLKYSQITPQKYIVTQ